MGIANTPPTSYSTHAGLVDTLSGILLTVPKEAITLNMIQYLLFPITTTLRQHDPFSLPDNYLEAVFRVLSLLVDTWKTLPGGMDVGAWEQLWRFATASIAPRVVDAGKGKAREVGQEVQVQCVNLLSALLSPSTNHPTSLMKEKVSTTKSPLIPTLLQTVTLLITMVSPNPPNTPLQLGSLKLLKTIVGQYLKGQHPILASILPGTISSISKMLGVNAQKLKGDIAALSAEYIENVISLTLSDEDLQALGILQTGLENLEHLAEEWDDLQTSGTSNETSTPRTDGGKDPFPPLTRSYLDFTSVQLLATLRPIFTLLTSHPSHLARKASASLAFSLIAKSHQSLPQLVPLSLSTLLSLSEDDFDEVRLDATSRLSRLLAQNTTSLESTLIDLLSETVNSLPRLITSHQEKKVQEASRLLVAIANTTCSSPQNPIADLLGPRGKVERWGWALLDCLEFGRAEGWSVHDNPAAKAAEKGWSGGLITSGVPLLLEGEQAAAIYQDLPLRYIESEKTTKEIKSALIALGSAGGDSALHAVDHFVRLAKKNRSKETTKAVSALWVAQLLLEGIAQGQEASAEGRASKSLRKMSKEVTRIVVAMEEEEDDEEEDAPDGHEYADADDRLLPVERHRGLDVVTTLLDRPLRADTSAAKETKRLKQSAQRVLLSAISLSTLSVTSKILSSSFRPLLLTVLYALLSQLASSHNLVATYAETTLGHVAYNCGYASVQNLILDNVDYVINVVSQRLTPSRLSSTAPLVLIAMIRMTRSEIVPMVHDIVDEIFDALDDYHGYEVLASGLLAVLVTLVDVMADDVAQQELSQARLDKLKELNRLGNPPDPATDFDRFKQWWSERKGRREEAVGRILERAPQHAWGKTTMGENEATEDAAEPRADDSEPAATRSEEITTQILTHRSPFLRAKILSLVSRAIPVLAAGNRESDLLPLIDKSWGIILLRMDDPLPYVVTEAAEVVSSLCKHVGDFMSRRIVDQAWPRIQKIMMKQQKMDDKSALARRGAIGTTTAWSVSHRLHMALLDIAIFVAKDVPVNDSVLWDMMLSFRPFLDKRANEEIQQKALVLYKALGVRDADALWTVLQSTVENRPGVWAYLWNAGLDITANATSLVESL